MAGLALWTSQQVRADVGPALRALAAVVLAERVSQGGRDRNHKHWPFIEGWAEELGLSGTDEVDKIGYTEHDAANVICCESTMQTRGQ